MFLSDFISPLPKALLMNGFYSLGSVAWYLSHLADRINAMVALHLTLHGGLGVWPDPGRVSGRLGLQLMPVSASSSASK